MICNKCGKTLPEDSEFCQFCGNKIVEQLSKKTVAKEDLPHKDLGDVDYAQTKTEQTNIKKEKNHFAIIAAIVITLVLISGTITIVSSVYYDGLYNDISDAMLAIDYYNYESTFLKIESLINNLPSNYRNIEQIKEQYIQIKKDIKNIDSAKLCNDKDSEKAREAYASLYEFNKQHHNWDLSEYLEGVLENLFSKFVFGKKWEDSNYYFQWYEDGDGDGENLWTSLPSNLDSNKDYYFYNAYDDGSGLLNPHQFGYENINNSADKFLAYRIVDISYNGGKWQIRIYCYSNSRTYTLN